MCSVKVQRALPDLMRMGSSAGRAQQAVFNGLVNGMHNRLDSLPAKEGGTLPTAAQVPCSLLIASAIPQQQTAACDPSAAALLRFRFK